MKKNVEKSVEKLKPAFFKLISNMENSGPSSTKHLFKSEEREREKEKNTVCEKTVTGAANFPGLNVKRKIFFDDSCTYGENNNSILHTSHYHTVNKRDVIEDFDKIEIANKESKSPLLNKRKTFINNEKAKKNKSRSSNSLRSKVNLHLIT